MKFLSRMTMFCQSFLWLATLVVCNSFTSMRYRTSTIISSRLYDNQNDINGGGGPGYVDDEKRSSEMQPSMTDVRNSNRQGGSMDRLEHGASVNILSVTSLGFLKNIEEYGKARMARKAVGILSKMQAYGEEPLQEHYTAAVGACEQSDQFDQSIGVFKEMKAMAIKPVVRTYEHLISCAEKTGHWEAALALFEEMTQEEGLIGTTNTYNSCMWAAEQGGRPDISLDLLSDMEQRGVHRDAATYAACAYSCEKAGQGQVALHVMDLMRTEGHEVSTLVYKAAIWACTKGGMWETALSLFDEMEPNGQLKDEESYSGAIWACVNGNLAPRAVELLKLMKFDGLPRKAVAYDGALTALQQAGMWAECLDMISWMDREGTAPTETTYTVIMQALDEARREDELMEIYLRSLRDGFFIPWVKGTRLCDLRGFTLPVAKVAIRNILQSMKDGKLGLFNLHMAYVDAVVVEGWNSGHLEPNYVAEHSQPADGDGARPSAHPEPSFDVKALETYILGLEPRDVLQVTRMTVEGTDRFVLTRDCLAAWTGTS